MLIPSAPLPFLLIGCLVTTATVAGCARPDKNPREILFQAQHPGDTEDLYLMDFASGVTRRLTHGERAFANSYAQWSPDGRRIAFIREFDDHNELFVLDSVSAVPRLLPTPGLRSIGWPDWSPDGARILIPAGPDWQHQKLYVIQLDGMGLYAIPIDSEPYSCASWSPDGRRVVASQGDSANSRVVAIEVVTGIREVLASSDSTELGCPDWSPDGKTVLVTVYHGTVAQREAADRADADLALLDVSSRALRALTHGPGVNNHGRWDHTGRWIVYQCTPNSSAGRDTTSRRRFFTSLEICAIRPDGTGRRRLTKNDYFDAHPSW